MNLNEVLAGAPWCGIVLADTQTIHRVDLPMISPATMPAATARCGAEVSLIGTRWHDSAVAIREGDLVGCRRCRICAHRKRSRHANRIEPTEGG